MQTQLIDATDRKAVCELAARYLAEELRMSEPMESPGALRAYLKAQLRPAGEEQFVCVYLDSRHRVIATEVLFTGTIDGATVYPRTVAKRCLDNNAAALVVAHNHPSGVSNPSMADQMITRRLKEALGLLDIRLLDHFVVGDGEPTSMAEIGML